jgi:hypothetical protein
MNYVLAGSSSGGARAATTCALIGSAKLKGPDPEVYRHPVLRQVPDHSINRVGALLIWRVCLAHPPTHQ